MTRRLTQEEFVGRAREIHGEKYDYSNTIYINSDAKIWIVYSIHGEFPQKAYNHLRGDGCPKCGWKTHTNEEFILLANKIHNNKYDYSKFEYIEAHKPSIIICPIHGEFPQRPSRHLREGRGCSKCGNKSCSIKKTITIEEFIIRSNIIHNSKYDYSKSVYNGCKEKLIIICPIHGEFSQAPRHHLTGNGCSNCGKIISHASNQWLNILTIPNDKEHREVKITLDRNYIVDGYDPTTKTCYEFLGDFYHGNLNIYDKDQINPVSKKTFGLLNQLWINRKIALEAAGYKVIFIWENDFIQQQKAIKILKKNMSTYSK